MTQKVWEDGWRQGRKVGFSDGFAQAKRLLLSVKPQATASSSERSEGPSDTLSPATSQSAPSQYEVGMTLDYLTQRVRELELWQERLESWRQGDDPVIQDALTQLQVLEQLHGGTVPDIAVKQYIDSQHESSSQRRDCLSTFVTTDCAKQLEAIHSACDALQKLHHSLL